MVKCDEGIAVGKPLDANRRTRQVFHLPENLALEIALGHTFGSVFRDKDAITRQDLEIDGMFQVFDLPEQNVTAGARNVSTVPTQALMLLNDPFVLRQAELFADRVRKEAGDDPQRQIDLAYRLALTRPPTETEMRVAAESMKTHSLVDLTHVLFNLNEFVYTR